MHLLQIPLIQLLLQYKYFIMVPLTLVEGPIIMMIGGFLWRLGLVSLIPTYFALMLGDLLGDVFWYCIGYFFGMPFVTRFGRFFSIDEKAVNIIKRFFYKHSTKILVISKLTMGFGFALVTLLTAGLVKIPFKKYLLLNVIGEFIWTAILMAVGYLLGHAYSSVNNYLEKITVLAMIIFIFFCLVGFGKYIRKRITQTA